MIAYCGLNCSLCEGYIATQEDDDKKRTLVAKKWSEQFNAEIKPEYINCDGCKSEGRKVYYCSNMCEIRKCCIKKDLAHCGACNMYACDTLNNFFKLAPEAKTALDKLRV